MAGKNTPGHATGKAVGCRAASPQPSQSELVGTPQSLRRTGSLRLRGEAVVGTSLALRRERTTDSLRPRRARPFRSTPGPAGVPSGTPAGALSGARQGEPAAVTVASARGTCSLPPSPALSRRNSVSYSRTDGPFSTEGIARNGTTFSSRCNKYMLHCAKRVDDDHYLTPTQRSTRDLRRLRALLDKAYEIIQQKDDEITHLKQQIVTLRLHAAPVQNLPGLSAEPSNRSVNAVETVFSDQSTCLPNPESSEQVKKISKSISEDSKNNDNLVQADPQHLVKVPISSANADVTHFLPSTDNIPNQSFRTTPLCDSDVSSGIKPLPPTSVCDSGMFDCLTSPSVSSKESYDKAVPLELEERLGEDWERTEHWVEWEEARLREEGERKVEELNRQHAAEYQEMKEKYNDKVEDLLQKLADANARLFELRPQLDASQLRIGQLELQLESARMRSDLRRRERADRWAQTEVTETAAEAELRRQLLNTQNDLDAIRALYCEQLAMLEESHRAAEESVQADNYPPAAADSDPDLAQSSHPFKDAAAETSSCEMDAPMRLQFLKSALFHFLTDRETYSGHLSAISAVLRFSDWERKEVERARVHKTPLG